MKVWFVRGEWASSILAAGEVEALDKFIAGSDNPKRVSSYLREHRFSVVRDHNAVITVEGYAGIVK